MAILFITVSSLVVVTVVLMKTRDLWWPPVKRRREAHRAAKNLDEEYRELVERYKRHGP